MRDGDGFDGGEAVISSFLLVIAAEILRSSSRMSSGVVPIIAAVISISSRLLSRPASSSAVMHSQCPLCHLTPLRRRQTFVLVTITPSTSKAFVNDGEVVEASGGDAGVSVGDREEVKRAISFRRGLDCE